MMMTTVEDRGWAGSTAISSEKNSLGRFRVTSPARTLAFIAIPSHPIGRLMVKRPFESVTRFIPAGWAPAGTARAARRNPQQIAHRRRTRVIAGGSIAHLREGGTRARPAGRRPLGAK